MPRKVSITTADFDLFDQDLTPNDYDFFKKHTGTFKRMLEDQVRAHWVEIQCEIILGIISVFGQTGSCWVYFRVSISYIENR